MSSTSFVDHDLIEKSEGKKFRICLFWIVFNLDRHSQNFEIWRGVNSFKQPV